MDGLLQRVRVVSNRLRKYRANMALRLFSLVALAVGAVPCAEAAAPPPFPAPSEAARKACSKPGRTTAEIQVCLTPQVWARSPIGAVQLGMDSNNKPTGRVFYAMVVGPGDQSVRPESKRKAVRNALQEFLEQKIAATIRGDLDKARTVAAGLRIRARANPALVFPTAINELEEQTKNIVWSSMRAGALNYASSTRRLFDDNKLKAEEFRLAIYEAECFDGCKLPSWATVRDPGNGIDRYGKLEVWQRLANIPKTQLTGVVSPDAFVGLEQGPLTEVRGLPAVTSSLSQKIAALERFVSAIRSDPKRFPQGFDLDSVVPKLVNLSQRSTLAIVDILQSPVTALHQLPTTGTVVLPKVSDELARTRILDCTRLRGEITPAGVGKCAGYTLDIEVLANCTTNKYCFPAVGSELVIDALMIGDTANIRALAGAAAFPRIKLAATMEELQARVDACATLATTEARAICLAKKAVSANQAATFDCAYKATLLKGKAHMAALEKCVVASLPPDQRRAVGCLQNFNTQRVDALLCLSEDKMSPEAKALAECVQAMPAQGRTKQSLTKCFVDKQVPGAATVMACLQRPGTDWKSSVSCAMAEQVGGDLGRALRCAQDHNASSAATAVCMVKIPGDLGKAAACLAQTNADPLGTLICTAGDSGMTVDQRIAVQCAAQTGGEPVSFTGCVVGQMTLKELGYCKGKRFGEGNCFNQNNEFRKIFAKAGVKIGPNSVVADVVNVHLKYLEAKIAVASAVIEVAKDLADKTKEALDGAVSLMDAATRSVIQAQLNAAQNVVNAGKGLCSGVVKMVFGKKKKC